ncbi:single-stranded-DNA-specific exonuclease RecJ [Deinococcus proteolyticus MRP]|uniref:Single-stranded-DNA-specific exonuclease RecJ n=1 Tax=Deinococcus proteolyticus (strain ATCC 35074 / DSM 20540 / JCM 6276 / NBRC 101906 / NCIMB 13154 / VKM Ac-1939 / CCM 2703 / MRP) TaxID=693977 RepID=F0RLG7_DEIPM|nr:DHH family phosphoesterase [Deinococcus sp. SL84]ADY25871.1 single-stranded-DNA-specific exonuclease RecJ [Deinococcus proteolyticus MRP]
MTPAARWQLARPAPLPALRDLMERYGLSAPAAQWVYGRGLRPELLSPEHRLTPNPGLREAARRLVQAIRAGKRIRIHGDYDADGVTATATLVLGLQALDADVHGFIPHRLEEGYGIHPSKLDEHAQSCDLLVTVDCGVSNREEVAGLLERGTDVIVTDHHAPPPTFPDCLVVHPELTANYDPALHNLTGAGVAYHLLWAVHQELGLPEPRPLSALATLGTIADVAPLTGENRALVGVGLAALPGTDIVGLRALLELSGVAQPSARDVAFVLAPRINAAGRMGEADRALELLTTSSPQRAGALAQYLEVRNEERRELQDRMYREALDLVDPGERALLVTRPDWHPGVMGIVASKLLEQFYRPVYIVAQGKGSVRSTPGISAVGGLRYSHDLLLRYGGHPGAAGFSLEEANLPRLRDRLQDYAAQFPVPVPHVTLDAPLPATYATLDLWQELQAFEPYGEGLRPPLWHLRSPLSGTRLVGRNRDCLQFQAAGLRGIKFREQDAATGPRDLAVRLRRSEFRGRVSAEWEAEELRPPQALTLAAPQAQVAAARLAVRRTPEQVMARLKAVGRGVAVYAGETLRASLAARLPELHYLQPGDPLPALPLVLFDLPPTGVLERWLQERPAAAPPVTFAWGRETLAALDAAPQGAEGYHRFQWAHAYLTLDEAGWDGAVRALSGLGVEEAATPPLPLEAVGDD